MNLSLLMVLEACILGASCSADAFLASFAYGSSKIKVPVVSVWIINIICSAVLGLSYIVGNIVKNYIPVRLTAAVCFCILFIIGITKLLDSATKSIIRKYSNINKELKFSLFNFKFILNLYANPQDADADSSKTISPAEAAALAISLSLDGIAVGFGAALGNVSGMIMFFWALLTGVAAVMLGCWIGNKAADRLPFNISWISGAVLVILAFMKLF